MYVKFIGLWEELIDTRDISASSIRYLTFWYASSPLRACALQENKKERKENQREEEKERITKMNFRTTIYKMDCVSNYR